MNRKAAASTGTLAQTAQGTMTAREPFGRPDANRADPHGDRGDAINDFIAISESGDLGGGLNMPGNDRTVRVIVGRKGAGKTLYLRRLHASAYDEPSIYTDDIQQSPPGTDEVARICSWYPYSIVVEKWMSIWKAATLRSIVSHILHSKQLRGIQLEHRAALEADFSALCGKTSTPQSIYAGLRAIVNDPHITSRARLDKYLGNPAWDELEYILGETLAQCPPLFFYIDAIDDEFRHAPMYWMMCQKGLFYQVMRFLSNARLGGRLHITICIRDIVYSSIKATEHGPRYMTTDPIRILNWNRKAVREFLLAKLRRLPTGPRSDVREWLGTGTVMNNRKPAVNEELESYLLRHTRLLPRDIIVMGNELCGAMAQHKTKLTGQEIRAVVRSVAEQFGITQLRVCANHIGSDLLPEEAIERGYSEIYTGTAEGFEGGDAYLGGIVDDLVNLLNTLGSDRFGRDRFLRFRDVLDGHFGGRADAVTALWQNGLLGYVDGSVRTGRPTFYGADQNTALKIPLDKRAYALHPILNDCLALGRGLGEAVLP